MSRIKKLDWYQKGILLLLAAMTVAFGVFYAVVTSRVGFLYMDAILQPSEENGNTVYSGTIQGQKSSFTVTPDRVVTFYYGDKVYGPYTAKEDPTARPKDNDLSNRMTGIEVREGNEVYFRGGVLRYGQSNQQWMLYNEDGTNASMAVYTSNGEVMDADRNTVDRMKPSVSAVLKLMKGPELTNKGHWGVWFICVFLSVIAAISVLFADEMFYWRLRYRIRDAELAEPSDWEIAGRYISWTLVVLMLLVFYIKGLQ